MALYITWTEQESEFVTWKVVSGFEPEPVFKTIIVRKYARYSSDESEEMIERAKQFIKTDMQDKPNAKVIRKD